MSRIAATPLIALLALTGACGNDDAPLTEKEQIAAAITDFNRAFADGDGERACSLITDAFRTSIELARDGSCANAVEHEAGPAGSEYQQVQALGESRVVNVQIVGEVATGDVVGPGLEAGPPAQAQSQDGRWLVSATAWGGL